LKKNKDNRTKNASIRNDNDTNSIIYRRQIRAVWISRFNPSGRRPGSLIYSKVSTANQDPENHIGVMP